MARNDGPPIEGFTVRKTFNGQSTGERQVRLHVQTDESGRRFVVFDANELPVEEKRLIIVAHTYVGGRVQTKVKTE
jgi:hypothetical protein